MRQLLLLILAFWLGASSAMAQTGDAATFLVTDVPVDVTADSAAHARDQAVAQAQRDAFSQLLSQMGADPTLASKLSDNDIATLTQNFEVQSERTSPVRYIGVFSVQFRPSAVRNYLGKKGARYSEARAKPVVILPIYAGSGQPVLWENHNLWRSAWDNAPRSGSLLPLITPAGGPDDLAVISTSEAIAGKADAIRSISDHYKAGSLAVVTLSGNLDAPSGDYKVSIQRYGPDGLPATVEPLTIPAPTDKTQLAASLAQGVKDIRAQLDKDYRQDAKSNVTAIDASLSGVPPAPMPAALDNMSRLTATAPITTLPEWVRLRGKVASTPGVAALDVITLERGMAVVELHFTGSIDDLQKLLLSQSIQLAQDPQTGGWVLNSI